MLDFLLSHSFETFLQYFTIGHQILKTFEKEYNTSYGLKNNLGFLGCFQICQLFFHYYVLDEKILENRTYKVN